MITISLVTALLPHLSKLAHDKNLEELGRQVSRTTRLVLAMMLPTAGLLTITAPALAVLLFGNGVAGADAANAVGIIVSYFAFGLPAYSMIYVLNRAWFAMEDTRTPFWIAVGINLVMLLVSIPLFYAASINNKVAMFGIGYSIAYLIMAVAAWLHLNRRIRTLESTQTLLVGLKLFIGAAIATLFASVVTSLLPTPSSQLQTLGNVLCVWTLSIVVYLACSHLLRIAEVQQALRLAGSRLRRS